MTWDCSECVEHELQIARRCNGGPSNFRHVTNQNDLFDRCPQAWLRDNARREVEYYSDYQWLAEYGSMPHPGGKLDQDPRFIEAIGLIAREVEKTRDKTDKKAQALKQREKPSGVTK